MISPNGGLTWAAMTVPVGSRTLYAVSCLDPAHCFAVGTTGTTDTNGHGVVLRTTNGSTRSTMSVAASVTALKAITCRTVSWCSAVGTNASMDAVALTYH